MSPLLLRRLSDEQLGSRLAAGEAAAFDELYRRYVHRLAAYGAHLLGDATVGDDVAQSSLLKAYAALRDGRVPERVRPWLYRIAHNTAIDLVARRRELPSAELPERAAAPGAAPTGALVAALAALPERQREVYALRELHGLRIDETAAELGLTAPQVEQALFAARNRMAEHLTFGERLNCAAVQRLAAGPLELDERRALKSHLRSCAACRGQLGVRGRVLSLLPAGGLEWLRGIGAGLLSGGAPVAAKVGVVVATATVAAGLPSKVDVPKPRFLPTAAARAAARPVRHPVAASAAAAPVTRRVQVAPVTVTAARFVLAPAPGREHLEHHGSGPRRSSPHRSGQTGSGDGAGHDSPVVPVATVPEQPTQEGPTQSVGTSGPSDGGVAAAGGGSGGGGSDGSGSSSGHDGSGDGTSTSDPVSGQNLDGMTETQEGHSGS